ncbi:uncharacterized protein CLUP02_03669 [Colletotrichum lupini]|uniref:Uncharacterized protein n=1 Tax=Colletotrichum lupini TaxID=145971 RepID=A0A9Q8SJ91_9PEZI|nr:uncharacterized protein CLUP02_03669 [Colletotrichum lupini]UQC78193.1 hypothetical protein CLUP02_03669 [Colletotrichum lupini]
MTVGCGQPNAIPACTTQPEYASSFSRSLPVLGPQIDALKRRLPSLAGSRFSFHLISWRPAWKRNSAEPLESLLNGVHYTRRRMYQDTLSLTFTRLSGSIQDATLSAFLSNKSAVFTEYPNGATVECYLSEGCSFPPTLRYRLLSDPGPCLLRYPLLRPPLSHVNNQVVEDPMRHVVMEDRGETSSIASCLIHSLRLPADTRQSTSGHAWYSDLGQLLEDPSLCLYNFPHCKCHPYFLYDFSTPGIRHSVTFMPASGAAISVGGECDRVLLHVAPIYNGQPLPEFGLPPASVETRTPPSANITHYLNPDHCWTTDSRDDDGITEPPKPAISTLLQSSVRQRRQMSNSIRCNQSRTVRRPLIITPLSKRPAVCRIPHHFVTSLYWFLGMASPEVCTPPAATPPLSKDEAIDRSFSATGRTLISSSEGQREDLVFLQLPLTTPFGKYRPPPDVLRIHTLFHLAKWDFASPQPPPPNNHAVGGSPRISPQESLDCFQLPNSHKYHSPSGPGTMNIRENARRGGWVGVDSARLGDKDKARHTQLPNIELGRPSMTDHQGHQRGPIRGSRPICARGPSAPPVLYAVNIRKHLFFSSSKASL